MKVLFLESDHRFIFGLPLGFRDLGHTIRVSGSISEENLNSLLTEFCPDLLVLLGWTVEHTDSKLSLIKKYKEKFCIPLIYWATEDPTFIEDHSLPLIQKTTPDYVFTVSYASIKKYRASGIKVAHLPFGYQPTIFQPAQMPLSHTPLAPTESNSSNSSFLYENCLIANAYPNVLSYYKDHFRRKSLDILVNPLLKSNIRLDIWGKHWDRMHSYLNKSIPEECLHGSIHYLKTNCIYNTSENVICLQNYSEDVITMRTYEILGCGAFMFTSFNHDINELFKPDRDFIVINSPEEMLEKYNYYKKHPQKKEAIRLNALNAVSEHTYKNRAISIIKFIEENSYSIFGSGKLSLRSQVDLKYQYKQ